MKVASFIIATLFIPPYPTNLVITTSPWVIGVRFRPPPLTMNSYNVACSLGRVAPLSPSGCPFLIDARRLLRIDTTPPMFSPLFRSTTPTDGPARGATQGQRHEAYHTCTREGSEIKWRRRPKCGIWGGETVDV